MQLPKRPYENISQAVLPLRQRPRPARGPSLAPQRPCSGKLSPLAPPHGGLLAAPRTTTLAPTTGRTPPRPRTPPKPAPAPFRAGSDATQGSCIRQGQGHTRGLQRRGPGPPLPRAARCRHVWVRADRPRSRRGKPVQGTQAGVDVSRHLRIKTPNLAPWLCLTSEQKARPGSVVRSRRGHHGRRGQRRETREPAEETLCGHPAPAQAPAVHVPARVPA